jgi:molybdenum cofactor biosynthesis enzyme MoaA
MKANNLTISIPYKGCDKNCPYCVSRITGGVETNLALMHANIQKVLTLARSSQVTSVLLTGKGEPFLNYREVLYFSGAFKEFPLEIQTNGKWLCRHRGTAFKDLSRNGMNVIAVSTDSPCEQNTSIKRISDAAHKYGMLLRITLNVTKLLRRGGVWSAPLFEDMMRYCRDWNADQLTLRNVVTPNNADSSKETMWIAAHSDPELYERLKSIAEGGFLIRTTPFGARIHDHGGIAVSYSDYCIQDVNNSEDIRSLIFQEDGHLYTSWNSRASRLF